MNPELLRMLMQMLSQGGFLSKLFGGQQGGMGQPGGGVNPYSPGGSMPSKGGFPGTMPGGTSPYGGVNPYTPPGSAPPSFSPGTGGSGPTPTGGPIVQPPGGGGSANPYYPGSSGGGGRGGGMPYGGDPYSGGGSPIMQPPGGGGANPYMPGFPGGGGGRFPGTMPVSQNPATNPWLRILGGM